MKKLSKKFSAEFLALATVLASEVGADELDDGGSSNWARAKAIGIAIAAVLLGLLTAFIPILFNKWGDKILGFFS